MKRPTIENLINIIVVIFIHNLILNKKPKDGFGTFVIPDRASKEIRLTTNFIYNNINNTLIHLYNKRPGDYGGLNRVGFKRKTKQVKA